MNIWFLLLFLLAGFLIGYFKPFQEKFYNITGILTMVGLIILLASMGAKIGVDDKILSQLDKIGFKAFLTAFGSVGGSILLVKLYSRKMEFKIKAQNQVESGLDDEEGSNRVMTFIIIGSVVTGILAGIFLIPQPYFVYLDTATTYALAILFLGIGIDIGLNKEIFLQVKELGWQILMIPILIAVGSIIGAVVIGLFIGLGHNEAAAVGAGFGWYSLSGVIIAKIYSVELGSLAFLSNVFRELMTIIFLPVMVNKLGKLSGIASGGATTMDVTLPLIKETAGEEAVIPAFISGVILTSLVPVLIPFLIYL